MIKNVYYKVAIIFVGFWWNLNFIDIFLKKNSNIKFHENPPNGSPVITCDRSEGQTNMMTLITLVNKALAHESFIVFPT